jgi:phosphatidylglycerol---prolipoprotein diacylglyceryl transferase
MIGLGIALGLYWTAWQPSKAKEATASFDAALWVLAGGLVGGRLGYVAASWPYFQGDLLAIPQVWLGGLSGPGSMAGALAALGILSIAWKLPAGTLAEALLPLAMTLTISAWLGCWLAGCAYGKPARGGWGIPAIDEWGSMEMRIPVQLLGAMLTLGTFWLFERIRQPIRGRKTGKRGDTTIQVAAWALLALTFQITVLSFLRADPTILIKDIRLDTFAWGCLTLVALITLITAYLHQKKEGTEERG